LTFIQQHYHETYRRCVLDDKLSKPFVRSRTAVSPSLRLLYRQKIVIVICPRHDSAENQEPHYTSSYPRGAQFFTRIQASSQNFRRQAPM